jgi:amino acid permease
VADGGDARDGARQAVRPVPRARAARERLGLWIIVPQQLIVEVGTDIVYMVTGGQSLKKVYDLLCTGSGCTDIRLTFWIMIFASVHLPLSQFPNFNSISAVSAAAAVMSLTYSIIASFTSVLKGASTTAEVIDYGLSATTTAGKAFGILNGLGAVAFAYAGHNVVLEIQATIPSTPEQPSKKPMWKGVMVAYTAVALCYFAVAFTGYYAFGNSVAPNILISLEKPKWLIAAANLMVAVHVVGSYQVFAMPVFDMIETVLVKKLEFTPGLRIRLIARSVYVLATMFIGMTFPFFDGLLGFFGGFGFAPTTYFIPCIAWLILRKPKKFGLTWFINVFAIVIGVLLMLASPIGGMRQIIHDVKSFKFYS